MITFKHTDDGRTVEITTQEITWSEVADEFLYFLRAVGFEVDKADLENHYWTPKPNERLVTDDEDIES